MVGNCIGFHLWLDATRSLPELFCFDVSELVSQFIGREIRFDISDLFSKPSKSYVLVLFAIFPFSKKWIGPAFLNVLSSFTKYIRYCMF